MRNVSTFFVLVFLILTQISNVNSQNINNTAFRCATDSVYKLIVQDNPQIALNRAKLDDFVRNYVKTQAKSDQVYIIPVVFHIIHTYGQENVSYEYLQRCVDLMNLDYRKLRPDTASIKEEFKPIAADARIEFRLAKIDPNGNCTRGVTRTYSPLTKLGGERVKFLDGAQSWDNSRYLNVWVVTNPGGGAAGWAYYPGTADDSMDGVLLMYDYLDKALTHEIGHSLNLPHPWGDSNDPGLPSNCDIDDGVDDTPNTVGHISCDLNAVSCGSLDNVQNFMEYSYCYKMFTNGQAERMRATLNSEASYRNNLWTEQNLVSTGTNEGYEAECQPIADFNCSKKIVCTGATVTYNDFSYNTSDIEHLEWNFEGGTPEVSNEENPQVTYNQAGNFTTELYAENAIGSHTATKEKNIRVYAPSDGYSLPYHENFESSTFPQITGNSKNDFYVENYVPNTQEEEGGWWNGTSECWRQVEGGYTGKALRIRNSRVNTNSNKIYLPNIKISNKENDLEVSFKMAVCRKSEDSYTDEIVIYLSTSCGDTLNIFRSISGSRIITAEENRPSTFVPIPDEYKTHTFTIPASKLKSENLRIILQSNSTFGNTIYIDDFSVSEKISNIEEVEDVKLSVFPNPFHDNLHLQSEDKEIEKVEIFNIMGKLLNTILVDGTSTNLGEYFGNETEGVYFLKIYTRNDCKTVKVVKE